LGNIKGGFDNDWCTKAVLHAIRSKYPKTRYTTTPIGTAVFLATWLLPERLVEMVVNYKAGNKKTEPTKVE